MVSDDRTALTIVPLIAEQLNISVKNDEQLVKLAGIVQRALSAPVDDTAGFILSEAEKEQLFSAAQEIGDSINGPVK